jgi:NADH dehydrogenase
MLIESLFDTALKQNVQFPLKRIVTIDQAHVIVGEVTLVDLNEQIVHTTEDTLRYDYLVIALGSKTNYYNVVGAARHTYSLKSIDDIVRIEHCITKLLRLHSSTALPINITIIGAGPSGVEIAAKLNALNYSGIRIPAVTKLCNVEIIEANTKILASIPAGLGKKAKRILKKQNIAVTTSRSVTRVTKNQVHLANGRIINSDCTIWTAGITPDRPKIIPEVAIAQNGQVTTDINLQLLGYPNVYAIGDIAASNSEAIIPDSAQAAVAASATVAKNIMNCLAGQQLVKFRYRSKGIIIPLGTMKGVGRIGRFNISGPIAWLGWNLIYVLRFPASSHKRTLAWHRLRSAL